MTVSSTTTRNSYTGDGTTTVFAYTFKIFDDDDITVILRTTATGTETVQTKTTDYSVSGVGDTGGGNITFGTPPTAAQTVVLLRQTAQTQTTDYTPNDPFPAASHEDALDKLTLIQQDQQDELDRAIKLSRTNTMTSTEFTVGASDRANKILAFDSSGELAVTQEIGTFTGDWASGTSYQQRDIIKDTSNDNIYIANTAHTSSGSEPISSNTDSAKWDLLVDAAAAATSASAAASSATAAAASATAAAASEAAAATSETNAAASEAGVAADAAAAAASASAADTSATNASTSETNAAASASAASTSETNAATSATSASTSASAASTSASNAATSATNASNSASAASTSASNAATSETNAATSETNASNSASSASTSASNAATSAAAAEAAFDAFDDIYLGAKASAPTVDNDGDALTEGDQYFNTTNNTLFVWNGSAWQAASPDIVGDTTPQLGGNLDTNGNDINFGDNDKAVFGAGSDLQIYHDGSDSYITDAGTGFLIIGGSQYGTRIKNHLGNDLLTAYDSTTELKYNGSLKLATTATGADITGTLTADGLTVDGVSTSSNGTYGTKLTYSVGNQSGILDTFGNHDLEFRVNNGRSATFATNGDVSLYASDNTTQGFFWDASTQRLGLGTTSPSTVLDIRETSTGGATQIRVYNTDNSNTTTQTAALFLSPDSRSNGALIYAAKENADFSTTTARDVALVFSPVRNNAQTERMRIDSSGNVGIGTSSVEAKLDIRGMTGTTTEAFLVGYGANGDNYYTSGASGSQIFRAANTEAARIDSGNLLVGTTDTTVYDNNANSSADNGLNLRGDGKLDAARYDGPVLGLNRTGTDGTLAEFRKSGSVVGGIGSRSGSHSYIALSSSGLANAGLTAGTASGSNTIFPTDSSGATRDNGVDLGFASGRFKDLYLSGGAYLGGTGSANLLDDYEEGTFQANFSPETSGTITISSTVDTLAYTKVGRLVTITGNVSVTSVASAVGGFVHLNNLPFTSADLDEFSGRNSGSISFSDSSAGTVTSLGTLMLESSSQIRMYVDASTVAAGDAFFVSFSYITT